MKIKYVAILLSILMLAALTACGGGDGDTTAPADDGGTTTEEAPATDDDADDADDMDDDADDADDMDDDADDDDGDETSMAGDAAAGETLYNTSCVACHGPAGAGVEGLGATLASSEFISGQSDEELVAFIIEGRPASHPDNVTGIDMPPKGGNPALSDGDILNIVAYLRTLQ